jgi:hypothetical protein
MSALRFLTAAFLLAAATPAFAVAPETGLTAERAVEIQQNALREAVGTAPCLRNRDSGDIVVCGRRGADPNRVPFPDQRLPGERENLLPGELPRAQASYDTCMFGCQLTGIRVDVFRAVKVGSKIVRHVLGKDD